MCSVYSVNHLTGLYLLAGIVWWLGNQFDPLSQAEIPNNFIAGLNPILTEAVLGTGMFLLSLLTFSIRSA